MDDKYKKLLNATYKYLGIRARSEKEIRDYLLRKISTSRSQVSGDKELIDLIVKKLKEQKFLNDEEFARMWVESRFKLKPRATRIIKMELKQKGISDEIIEQVFANDDLQVLNDREAALMLAENRMERLKNETLQKRKEKLFRFLASKGYSYDTIKAVVDQILGK